MKGRKLLSAIIAGAMVLGTMSLPVFAEDSVNWDDSNITITTESQLREFAEKVNEGNTFADQTIILGNNITLNDEWIPIGNKETEKYFSGTFDGANKEISGLSITDDGDGETDYFALFGATQNATIKDLTVSGSVHEKNAAGFVARMNGGAIKNCVNNVAVTAIGKGAGIVCLAGATEDVSVIDGCVNNNTITIDGASNAGAAGIISYISNTGLVKVTNCVNNASVNGGDYAGGILSYGAGNSQFIIDSCENNRTVNGAKVEGTAGIVGFVGGGTGNKIIANCVTGGDVAGTIQSGIFINNTYTDSVIVNATVSNYIIDPVALVNDETYCATLADAFSAAQDSDTITILSETNSEELNIPALTNVTIEGAEGIKPMLKNVCEISAGANNVTFSNIEFSQTEKTLKIQGKNITFKDCDFNARTLGYWDMLFTQMYNGYGDITTLKNAENITFENCKFDGMGTDGELPNVRLVASPSCKNLTIKKCSYTNAFAAFYYGCISGDWLVEDSVFDIYAYTTHTASDTVCESLTVKRTSFNGWTSYAGVKQALLEDCTFGGGTGNYYYPVLRAYSNTTLRNCTFSPDFNVEAGENTYPKWVVDNCKRGDEVLRRNEQFFSEEVDRENQEVEFIFPSEAKVIDTAKTTGAEITLDNLNAHENVDVNADATYKVVVETAPKADADAVNKAIEDSKKPGSTATPDNNTEKAIFDISVVKVDSNGVETDLGGTESGSIQNQQVTLTLGDTPQRDSKVFVYHVDDLGNVSKVAEVIADGTNKVTFTAPSFSTYAVTYTATAVDPSTITSKVGVVFSPVSEGSNQYYITLKALDAGKKINRFMSADLAFVNNSAAIDYEIKPAANMNAAVINENGTTCEYRFDMDGLGASCATGEGITIGTITFSGYGTLDFSVNDTYTAGHAVNIVNTAEAENNIVDNYMVSGGTLLVNDAVTGNPQLAADEKGTITGILSPAKKNLTVNVKFNNTISDNAKAYQDMKAVISGGDLTDDITVNFGTDENALAGDTYTFTQALTQNVAYTVTISGAGYRTARHTVTMTTDKTLNFWNNIKDTAEEIETGKGAKKANFLAGDIVKDNNINIYDLSAVVSYFGTANLVAEHPEYAKYDLNRDGKIDSKDVAYVLVSWGN